MQNVFPSLKEDISRDNLQNVGVLVMGCPKQKFTQNQLSYIRKHLDDGGGLFVMLEEGGEKKSPTNINFLLEEFGIAFNNGNYPFNFNSSLTLRHARGGRRDEVTDQHQFPARRVRHRFQ